MNTNKNPLELRVNTITHATRDVWLALWKALPEDTEIYKVRMEFTNSFGHAGADDVLNFRLMSIEFDPVPTNTTVPELTAMMHRDPVTQKVTVKSMRIAGVEPHWFMSPLPPTRINPPVPGPTETPDPYRQIAEAHRRANARCTCDLAYTGMKTHKVGCPCK